MVTSNRYAHLTGSLTFSYSERERRKTQDCVVENKLTYPLQTATMSPESAVDNFPGSESLKFRHRSLMLRSPKDQNGVHAYKSDQEGEEITSICHDNAYVAKDDASEDAFTEIEKIGNDVDEKEINGNNEFKNGKCNSR